MKLIMVKIIMITQNMTQRIKMKRKKKTNTKKIHRSVVVDYCFSCPTRLSHGLKTQEMSSDTSTAKDKIMELLQDGWAQKVLRQTLFGTKHFLKEKRMWRKSLANEKPTHKSCSWKFFLQIGHATRDHEKHTDVNKYKIQQTPMQLWFRVCGLSRLWIVPQNLTNNCS